jgi:hypothetical protein
VASGADVMGRGRQCPLVFLSQHAREQAQELALDRVVENIISDRISLGQVTHGSDPRVYCGDFVARVRRRPPLIRPRGARVWLVTEIQPREE